MDARETRAHQSRRLRGRLAGVAASCAVLVVLGLFAALFGWLPEPWQTFIQTGNFTLGSAPPTPTVAWETYADPSGLFSVRIPANWTASHETGTATYGDRTGSATVTSIHDRFSDPTLGDASAAFFVYALPITTDFDHQWYCQGSGGLPATQFHGIPATTLGDGVTAIFDTTNGHFQIAYSIPGVKEPIHSTPAMTHIPPTPTPLPQAEIQADQTIIDSILASFTPASTTPLACPA